MDDEWRFHIRYKESTNRVKAKIFSLLMNIFVTNTINSDFYLKPDSSLVKESFNFYRPDDAQIIQLSVCVAFKSIRSAKFINKK